MRGDVLKYNIIYADPPWSYDDKSLNRGGALRHYKTMSLSDICNIPVKEITSKDCTLFIWATWPKLFESQQVINNWGFEYKTCAFVWVKTNKNTNVDQSSFFPVDSFDSFWGMGRWTRANTEFCLLATKGTPQRKSCSVHQIIYAPIMRHSKKPDETKDRIMELVGDLPRIELFARKTSPGWDVWGNEVKSNITIGNAG